MGGTKNSCKTFLAKHRTLWVCLFFVISTTAVYWQTTHHEFVNFDDPDYVTKNPHVQAGLTLEGIVWAFTTTHTGYWHPLTWLSIMLDCQLYGTNPGRHHLTSLLFHIVNTLLLFFVFRKMTGDFWPSAFIAALFALHPLHVESVAWTSERKDLLYTFFWMLGIWTYIRYANRPGAIRMLPVLLCFTLGLMAKPMMVTFPCALLLLDYWPLGRLQAERFGDNSSAQPKSTFLHLLLEKIPFFIFAAIIGAATFLAQKQGGGLSSLGAIPIKIRIANALVSYGSYIGKMIWPTKMAIMYPLPIKISWWKVIAAAVLILSISALAIKVVKQRPYFIVGWLWYLGTLFPVIGLVQSGRQAMADRYTYVPLIGLFVIIAWGVPEFVLKRRHGKMGLIVLTTLILAALAATSWKQTGYWKNSILLFEHALSVTTGNYLAHNNLGVALANEGRTEEAVYHYVQALQIYPNYDSAHNNLGFELNNQGKFDAAIRHYTEALRINPDYSKAHFNMANALASQGKFRQAVEHYTTALHLEPGNSKTHNNLGNALAGLGKLNEAFHHFTKAIQLNPGNEEALSNIETIKTFKQRIDAAIEENQQQLDLYPDNPGLYNNLGNLYKSLGEFETAIQHYRKALSIRSDFVPAANNLAIVYLMTAKPDKALAMFENIVELQPDNPAAYYNVACVYSRQNRVEPAVSWLKKAIDKGYDKWELIKTDKDLENIRHSPDYKALVNNR